jgi:hypothetical protein
MYKWLVRSISVLTMIVIAGTVVTTGAFADQASPGQGLEISPPVIELNADPGQTLTTTIRVRNIANGTLIAKGKADDFGASASEDGKPQILLGENGTTRYSLKTWIQGIPDFTLAPKELKTATVTIVVPKNAEPGGHFGVVRFTAVPPSLEGSGVSLSASVGTLILLRVSGVVTEKVNVESFNTIKTVKTKGKSDTTVPASFYDYGPINFNVRIHNTGSVHEKVAGTIKVTDTFGNVVGAVIVNENGGNVLPDSIRKFEAMLNKKNLIGHFTAKLELSYLGGTKVLSSATSFWVIPWKAILLVVFILIALFFILRFALRKYNAHVIAQARKQ